MSPDEFPEHIKALLQCMQEQEERERLQRELDRSMCKVRNNDKNECFGFYLYFKIYISYLK